MHDLESTKWHEMKIQEREASRRGFYVPWTKADTWKRPEKIRLTVLPTQIRTRSNRDFLARIGAIEPPECWW